MSDMEARISRLRMVPVIKLDRVRDAIPLAEALSKGGLPVAEITFRTEAAEESIRRVAKEFPNLLVGAGTVVAVEQAKRASDAGAQFIVSAGFSREVVAHCVENKLPVYPGVCTPSELMWLLEYGLEVAKFFPAAAYGGLKTIKALAAPFPMMRFIPTGGISEKNVLEYLAFDRIIACGGSWMVKDTLIAEGKFDEIEKLVAQAVELVKR
ncbi:MAG: bifunctional 4-hydroxy-2-oxoglutarate aldolase/2-dehydro-3-deoxy-phosphogluconate aldolase [Planctomycetota bacterium]|jgi:2-dehydro-3-deoxyphosphogluconate aldolase/(4S)-4-hydroxy-2-oxoglutarate aldolase|nr:bifunctional 4-hydroxy-2-oxoglutarate aldolase/2-dehydro-3-deoxy-phosphogluconate aldolase [Planctomycetota bacterium]